VASLLRGVETAPQHECGDEPRESRGGKDGGRSLPAEVLDPQAEHHRTGKLAKIAGLLDEPDGRRHGAGAGAACGAAA
jgi:hypothetical protein